MNVGKKKWLMGVLLLLVSCSNEGGVLYQGTELDRESVAADTLWEPLHDTVFVQLKPSYDTVYVQSQPIVDTVYLTDTIVQVEREVAPGTGDTSVVLPGADTLNIVYFGNSLVRGFGTFGASASTANNDYCAWVNRHFSSRGFVVNGTRVSSDIFERLVDPSPREEIVRSGLYPQLSPKTDVVVIQLGDNVTDEILLEAFKVSFADLVDSVRNHVSDSTKIVCVASWYRSVVIDRARESMKKTAREKGCTFVDISDLFADECNRSYLGAVVYRSDVRAYSLTYDDIAEKACTLTISFSVGGKTVTSTILPDSYSIDAESKTVTWEGHEYVISNPDVASHPGDRGFERIAERIIDAI